MRKVNKIYSNFKYKINYNLYYLSKNIKFYFNVKVKYLIHKLYK